LRDNSWQIAVSAKEGQSMANTIVGLRFPGDAVVSYGALKRAGECSEGASLPAVLTAVRDRRGVVLYERLCMRPSATPNSQRRHAAAWTMLQARR